MLMLGPAPASPRSRGGMATVAARMIEFDAERADITFIPTFDDRNVLVRTLVGVSGMVSSSLRILAGHAEVVHAHLSHGGSVLRKSLPLWIARKRGVPTVIHAHSYNFVEWYESLSPRMRTLVRRSLIADRWLVLGEEIGNGYARSLGLPPEKLSVLYNPAPEVSVRDSGIDSLTVSSGMADSGPIHAAALGRLGTRKGTFDILAAIGRLSPEVRARLRLVLAGDGEVDDVRAEAAVLNAAGARIEVRDWIGPSERDELLAASSVFLLPSYDEGLPMALLEAMAAGLAPITTPVGSIDEIIHNGVNGIIVEPGDVEALARALESLITDHALRRKLADGALDTARQLSRDQWERQLGQLWHQLAVGAS